MEFLSPVPDFLASKSLVRDQARLRRRDAARNRPDAAIHAAALLFRHLAPTVDQQIAVYQSIGDELDSWPLAQELLDRKIPVGLPAVTARNSPLEFRQYRHGQRLEKGAFDIPEPSKNSPVIVPDIIVAPLLAFTRDGIRLGMGGGYYDRTLKILRAQRSVLFVGYAYGLQEMARLPREAHDQILDWIITEREAICVNPSQAPLRPRS